MSKILEISTAVPNYLYQTSEIIEAADKYWLKGANAEIRNKTIKFFQSAQINQRASVVPLEVVFSDLSFEERNNIYIKKSIELGIRVLEDALVKANLKAKDLDAIITVSCTGFMIPSVDAYLINHFKMRSDIQRLPVTEIGCAGGTAGLIYASQYLKAFPNSHVALLSIEIPSITFQKKDFSIDNLVSTAIFADGASCVILGNSKELKPEIIATEMYHFPNSTHLMGYHLQNSGLKIILSKEVPAEIAKDFPNFFLSFLHKNNLAPEEIDHYIFHPGGKKIISFLEDFLSKYNKNIDVSKKVFSTYGNLSSSTILYILKEVLEGSCNEGDIGHLLAFGPGFTAQSVLLKWT